MAHWDRSDWSGSGHAQSMLVVGRPQLATTKTPRPFSLHKGLRSERFPGTVELLWTIGHDEHLVIRWCSARRQASVPRRALSPAYRALIQHAIEMECDRLRDLHGEDFFDEAPDDDPRFDSLDGDCSELVTRHADALAPFYQGRPGGDYGTWRLAQTDGGVMFGWRVRRKESLLPLGVLAWVGEDLQAILDVLAAEQS